MVGNSGNRDPGSEAGRVLRDAEATLEGGGDLRDGIVDDVLRLDPAAIPGVVDGLFRRVAMLERDRQDAAADAVAEILRRSEHQVAPDLEGLLRLAIELRAEASAPTYQAIVGLLRQVDGSRLSDAMRRLEPTIGRERLRELAGDLFATAAMGGGAPEESANGGGQHAEPPVAANGGGGQHAEPPMPGNGDPGPRPVARNGGGTRGLRPVARNGGGTRGLRPVARNGGGRRGQVKKNGGSRSHSEKKPSRESARASAERPAGPVHKAYGGLTAPDRVAAGEEFELRIGLSKRRPPGVAGGALSLPAPRREAYTIDVQLVADTFDLAPGESFRQELKVSTETPYPSTKVHLTARSQRTARSNRMIQVTFGIGGETLGVAIRTIEVLEAGSVPQGRRRATVAGITAGAPVGEKPADVTIEIFEGNKVGALRWSVRSPHPGVAIPADSAVENSIGSEPRDFEQDVKSQVQGSEGKRRISQVVGGLSEDVAAKVPVEVWASLRAASRAVGGKPLDVLILSQEEYVPWELAAVADPPLVAGAPPFLGAQANVGRWLLGESPPPSEPPRRVVAGTIAVVEGSYDGPNYETLPGAAGEAKALKQRYQAQAVKPTEDDLFDLLDGKPAVDVIHFAVHGRSEEGSAEDGLIIAEGEDEDSLVVLPPYQVRGATKLRASGPFVFLNACQVGAGRESLGMYGGIAAAFLKAGASAVVAPIWSIDDKVSHEIALGLYEQSFATADPPSVATLLREARGGFVDNTANSATYVAYQLYGHPSLRLVRKPGSR